MRGSRDAEYTEYVQSRLPWLRRVAYLLCQDWQSADDLVQSAITRLYTHWGRARDAASIDAYTRTIMVRVFISERRSAWARRVTLFPGSTTRITTRRERSPTTTLAWSSAPPSRHCRHGSAPPSCSASTATCPSR